VACLAIGVMLGLLNGAIVTLLEVPSFIATLGTMIISSAIALALTNGGVVTGLPEGFRSLSTLRIAGLPVLVWITVLVFVVLWWLHGKPCSATKSWLSAGTRKPLGCPGFRSPESPCWSS
jgi:ribose transport system permease protein